MTRLSCCLLLFLAGASPARAHFLWVLPGDTGATKVHVVFSDAPRPDDPALLKKIAHSELSCRTADGPAATLHAAVGKDALEADVPGKGLREIGAVCHYGVVQLGKSEPFLLHYYAKGFVGLDPGAGRPSELFFQPWEGVLPLEIVPVSEREPCVVVLWQGKPLAGAEVVVVPPDKGKPVQGKTGDDGRFRLPDQPMAAGVYGIRARFVEKRSGEQGGKAYKEVRHYATLSVPSPHTSAGSASADRPAADPEATRLLAEARAARAVWSDFPGFTADVDINLDGKVTHAHLTVNAKGKVKLEPAAGDGASDKEALGWARGQLASIVAHRLDTGNDHDTPCAFTDNDTTHPLGRAIRVVNDEFDSSYRVRDRQILVVNRRMRDSRFTITVLHNHRTSEDKYLPVSYVVDTWDLNSGQLQSSSAFHQTWEHVGHFDLPRGSLVVTATPGKQQARSVTLSGWKLLSEK
jgi:hypothetical protein